MGGQLTGASDSYFLSYSRSDERFALRLATDLRARGIATWIDQLDIRPSEHWDRAVERAVRSCRGLIVVLSPQSAESDNVADEISFALDSRKSVLPVMIKRCTLPLRITRMQVIDATGDYERALERCVKELTSDGDDLPKVEPAPQAPIPIDPQTLATAKERLAGIVGPIAGLLVTKAAARSTSARELYKTLSEHIGSRADREHFLAHIAAPSGAEPGPRPKPANAPGDTLQACSIPTDEIDRMSHLMTRYIGPIAAKVVKRESRSSASLPELRGQLAQMISDDDERAEFLRLVDGH